MRIKSQTSTRNAVALNAWQQRHAPPAMCCAPPPPGLEGKRGQKGNDVGKADGERQGEGQLAVARQQLPAARQVHGLAGVGATHRARQTLSCWKWPSVQICLTTEMRKQLSTLGLIPPPNTAALPAASTRQVASVSTTAAAACTGGSGWVGGGKGVHWQPNPACACRMRQGRQLLMTCSRWVRWLGTCGAAHAPLGGRRPKLSHDSKKGHLAPAQA